jgi:HK97 family phage portal protein
MMGIRDWLIEKLNPAQGSIARNEGVEVPSSTQGIYTLQQAYKRIEAVNRGVNLLVDCASDVNIDISNSIEGIGRVKGLRVAKLHRLLNHQPNPYISISAFRSNIFVDLLLDGNAFIYWDGAFLYNLPAPNVDIETDKSTFVKAYVYNDEIRFSPEEVIHVRDNSTSSIYRGTSRLASALDTINTINNMTEYQKTFFKNSTVSNLVLKTPNILGKRIKERILEDWARMYNPKAGGRRPIVLDGEFELEQIGNGDFKELDFINSNEALEAKIFKTLGIPPVLMDAGNNANLSPNNRLFYTNTVLPLIGKLLSGFEIHFGYDLKPNTHDVFALKPELRDTANYLSTLANAGIMTRNEARELIRLPKATDEHADQLILPANVAGSAQDAGQGGRPNDEDKQDAKKAI